MKKLIYCLVLHFLLLNSFCQTDEKRLALVIGNADYQNGGTLENPVNDANLMANTLSKLGFDVIKKTNADLKTMQKAEVDFKSKLKQYNVALFYYAGHGIQVDGINYLIPVDAKLDNKEYTRYEAFDISNINNAFMAGTKNINIMILDACRDNPFRNWERGGERGFKKIENTVTGTIIALATQPGETAADGTGLNGLYTKELVKQMLKPQAIEQVFKQTRIEVNRISNGKQIPQDWSSLMADFYFTRVEKKLNPETNNIMNSENGEKPTNIKEIYDPRDGQTYKTIKIGNQVWMAENLNYDGGSGSWYYFNNSSYGAKYGKLYNWETAKKVCPDGWHLPSKTEFEILLKKYGGEGEKSYSALKEDGYSRFNALSGGHRSPNGGFSQLGNYGAFWSSTENNGDLVWVMYISSYSKKADIDTNSNRSVGRSVRCLKD